MEQGVVKMLIPTPNGTNKIGFNTDRYVFDPTCTTPKDIRHLKFLGLLFGVAMRTRKPLNLHLARPMWKLLAGMTITADDLEEVSEREGRGEEVGVSERGEVVGLEEVDGRGERGEEL